jgi:hypothetical protein
MMDEDFYDIPVDTVATPASDNWEVVYIPGLGRRVVEYPDYEIVEDD